MKTINKELNLLEISDVEKILTEYFGKPISISDVECELTYGIPFRRKYPDAMFLTFTVDGERFESIEEFYDWDTGVNVYDGKRLSLSEPFLLKEDIFAFDVSAFKSFDIWVDSSD